MQKIEEQLRSRFFQILLTGVGVVILISAVSLWILAERSRNVFQEMSGQSEKSMEEILTEEMKQQTIRYGDACGEIIEQKLRQTKDMLELISGEIRELYQEPEKYPFVSYQNSAEISGEGRKMQWILPEGVEEERLSEEIGLLGNIQYLFEQCFVVNEKMKRVYFTSVSGINIGYDGDYEQKPAYFEGREQDWYVNAVHNGEFVLSEAYRDSFLNTLTITFSMPCYDEGENLLGVLAADLLIDDLEQMIEEIQLEFGGYAILLSQDGKAIAAQGLTVEDSENPGRLLGDQAEQVLAAVGRKEEGTYESSIQGKRKYIVTSTLSVADWSLLIVLDQNAFNQAAETGTICLRKTASKTMSGIQRFLILAAAGWCMAVAAVCAAVIRHSQKLVDDVTEPISRMSAEKERLATELDVATQIQTSMLPCIFPAFPERMDIDIYASMCPAREVGGDFYDFFLADEEKLFIVMADVSGKGIPAALFMVVAKTLLKDNLQLGYSLKETMERVNSRLCENNEAGMFVTAFAACLDLKSGKMEYVNAGHNPPLVRKESETTEAALRWLTEPSGFVMAGMENLQYETGIIQLEEGDLLFAYTDGVTEAQSEDQELFGEERLFLALREKAGLGFSAQEIVESVSGKVADFVKEAEPSDDVTMFALIYRPFPYISARRKFEAKKENLPAVMAFVEQMLNREAEGKTISDEAKFWLYLVTEEIFVNIASYAYGRQTEPEKQYVIVECSREIGEKKGKEKGSEQKVTLTFRDCGIPYNPLEHRMPDIRLSAEERPVGGLGIHIVKESMDTVEYRYEKEENVLKVSLDVM